MSPRTNFKRWSLVQLGPQALIDKRKTDHSRDRGPIMPGKEPFPDQGFGPNTRSGRPNTKGVEGNVEIT